MATEGKAGGSLTYDFADPEVPKAVPYGVYDVRSNNGFVNVGTDHDTPFFAVHSIKRWWELMGALRYPDARELFITADAGGSNSRQSNVWKAQLQAVADRVGIAIHVSHYPPGTSKWNKIEHRLFSFISINWRGRPLASYETVVALIAATRTKKGLTVTAELDKAKYPLGIRVKRHVMMGLNLERASFHGEWNYTLRPRTQAQLAAARKVPAEPEPITREERTAKWKQLFRDQQTSGLTDMEFCRRTHINYWALRKARKRLLG